MKQVFRFAPAFGALFLFGCSGGRGDLGQPCSEQAGGAFGSVSYNCNAGLVCNYGLSTPTCENPHADGVGVACGSDQNCASGLFCAPMVGGARCSADLGQGAPCPSGLGCAAGLTCLRSPDGGPVCGYTDAGMATGDAIEGG